jgi:hypothetical protein
VHRFAHPQNSKKKRFIKTSHLIMILHLVFSAVSCSPELFLIFRMSVERKKKSKKSARERREIFALSPTEFFSKIDLKRRKKKKMNRVHLETEKHTHPQSATPAETPSGPVAPPASARARSALSSPSLFLLCVCVSSFFTREMRVCALRDFFFYEEEKK